jgi:hypothetical protein
MTENYSSGNIKIREKLSMHMRHKILCSVNFQIQNFLREKSALSTITKSPNLRTKPVLSKPQNINKIPGKIPNLQICCTCTACASVYDC